METDQGAPPAPGGGAVATPLDRVSALAALRTMWRIRVFEQAVGMLKRADEVYGLIHLSIGGEGVAAAVCSQLRDEDPVYTGHRGHGHAIAKGAALERVMAELMGRSDGLCRGFGGSMHLVDVEHGLMGATGVVGGNVPLALGSGLASRLRGSDAVAVVFFGDGAVQAGHFNEAVNLAALWALPVILVCENNGMAEFTSREEHSVIALVSDVVAPYGLVRETVDGSDVAAVWEAFGRYLWAARGGEGPFLLECLTHRQRGHYEGDPSQYREAIAEDEWQQRDPISRLARTAASAGWFGDAEAAVAEADARAEVEAAIEFARASPYPAIELLEQLVYAR